MITLMTKDDDLFKSDCSVLVNTVNCNGVMGKGIAAAFKAKYPDMFKHYKEKCEEKELKPGEPYIYCIVSDLFRVSNSHYIMNFPTKDNWRENSKIEWISYGLDWVREYLENNPDHSIAIPALGCSNGNLDWNQVFSIIKEKLSDLPNDIKVYPPH